MAVMRRLQSWLTALCAVTLVLSFIPHAAGFAYLSVALGSVFAVRAALESLSAREIDVNLLMVMAAAGAVGLGHPADAAALLFLFSLSSTLESFAMARTHSAIEGLIKLRPAEAILLTPEGSTVIPVEDLKLGDLIRIAPFAAFPVDGSVCEGSSSVDQSAVTG